jgi:uncharacterized protein (TIGR00251 family)
VISDAPGGAIIDIKVIPRAGRTAVAGTRGHTILIRLAAAPVAGAANIELLALLAEVLQVPKRHLTIVSGEKSRTKRLQVAGLDAATVRARIDAAARQ